MPRKLGLFTSSRLLPTPYACGPALPTAFAEVVGTFLLAAVEEVHGGMAQVKAAILQQWRDSGLLSTLDLLAEATAQQLEQCTAAAAAAEGAARARGVREVQLLTTAAARLLFIQVDWRGATHPHCLKPAQRHCSCSLRTLDCFPQGCVLRVCWGQLELEFEFDFFAATVGRALQEHLEYLALAQTATAQQPATYQQPHIWRWQACGTCQCACSCWVNSASHLIV